MTLSTTTNRVQYSGDGATTVFAIAFPFLQNSHIQAILTDANGSDTNWVEGTHYTLTGAGDAAGGTLTVVTTPTDHTPAVGETFTILRVVPNTQLTDYLEGGAFPAGAHETALDLAAMRDQQLQEQFDRAPLLKKSTAVAAGALVMPEPVSGQVIGWNNAATALENKVIVPGATIPPTVNVKDFGAKGDGATDDRAAIQAAIDSLTAGIVFFPAGQYKVLATLNINSAIHLVGEGSNASGTHILFGLDDGTSLFKSDSTQYLSHFRVQDMRFKNTLITAGTAGQGGHCFELYGLTNNSAFERVEVEFFGGSAFKIGKQTGNSGDKTACGNVLFNQVFVSGSMGAYGFDIDGYVNATWLMCDISSPMLGGFHFVDGVSNQAMINIVGLWYESGAAWAANDAIIMDNTNSQPLSVIGSNFQGAATAGGAVVKMIGATAGRPSLHNVTGFNYDYAVDDQVNGYQWGMSAPGSVDYGMKTRVLTVEGALAAIDIHDLAGSTVNQRRWRFNVVGNLLALQSRLDNGGGAQVIAFFTHNTKKADFQGQVNATSLTINNAAIPNTTLYESTQQTITSGGTLTLAHGLGVQPKLVQFWIKNTVAEHGYSVGDEIPVGPQNDVSVVPDATNLIVQMRVAAQFATIQEKATGNPVNTTNTSWKLVVRAWA